MLVKLPGLQQNEMMSGPNRNSQTSFSLQDSQVQSQQDPNQENLPSNLTHGAQNAFDRKVTLGKTKKSFQEAHQQLARPLTPLEASLFYSDVFKTSGAGPQKHTINHEPGMADPSPSGFAMIKYKPNPTTSHRSNVGASYFNFNP